MSRDTSIQWCDSSVNPSMGCDGCELWSPPTAGNPDGVRTCYAGAMHLRYGGRPGYAPRFEDVTLFPGRMAEAAKWGDLRGKSRPEKPWLDGRPRHVFVGDMGDLLSRAVSFEYLKAELIDVASSAALGGARHVWMVLTKRPSRLAMLSRWLEDEHGIPWPANVWAMTTVTSPATTKRIDCLLHVGNSTTTRMVSVEPLLAPLDIRPWLRGGERTHHDDFVDRPLDGVIVGGESEQSGRGGGARVCTDRALMGVVEACQGTPGGGTACFVKQLGSRFVGASVRGKLVGGSGGLKDHHGGDWGEWPEALRVRVLPPSVKDP